MAITIKSLTPGELFKQLKQFSSVSGLFTYATKAKVDSLLFKLHCKMTVFIIFAGTVFLTMRQYFGEPIECLSGKSDVPTAMIQRYCWMEGSFSAFSRTQYYLHPSQIGYPGIKAPDNGDKIVYHKYYQWVYFVLILQGVIFYIPRYVWKSIEGDRLRDLLTELRDNHISSLEQFDKYRILQDVSDTMYLGPTYWNYFVGCEILCFINLVVQIWFTNIFLGGSFWNLGFQWYNFSNSEINHKYDPLILIFPRFAKCSFHKYGHSGTMETIDSLCFLLLNIVNEKIYVTLWFWYSFLLIFTVFFLIYRLFFLFPCVRYLKLKYSAQASNKAVLRRLCNSIGNWFILQFIADTIKPSYFCDMFEELIEIHFDKKGHAIISSKFKETIECGDKVVPKKNKPKSKSKSKSSSKQPPPPGFNIDWDTPNQNEDWNDNQTIAVASAPANDDWENDNKNDDWNTTNDNKEEWNPLTGDNNKNDEDWNTDWPE